MTTKIEEAKKQLVTLGYEFRELGEGHAFLGKIQCNQHNDLTYPTVYLAEDNYTIQIGDSFEANRDGAWNIFIKKVFDNSNTIFDLLNEIYG